MKQFALAFLPSIILLALFFGTWSMGAWINYKLAYESGVKATIEETVKPECLK